MVFCLLVWEVLGLFVCLGVFLGIILLFIFVGGFGGRGVWLFCFCMFVCVVLFFVLLCSAF